MPFTSIANPEQLALTKALQDHCDRFGIPHGPEGDSIAVLAVALFNNGKKTIEELTAALVASRGRL